MRRSFRLALAVVLIGCELFLASWAIIHYKPSGFSAKGVVAQTSAPTGSAPAQQTKAVTASPVETVEALLAAVQAGDMDIVSKLTGGTGDAPGIVSWNSTSFVNFVGHTTCGRFYYVVTYNNGQKANVHCKGDIWFADPAGFPAVVARTHWYVHGDFKLKASGDSWVVTALPWYQEQWLGRDPNPHPWPGDAIR